jgi:hypothetical protein
MGALPRSGTGLSGESRLGFDLAGAAWRSLFLALQQDCGGWFSLWNTDQSRLFLPAGENNSASSKQSKKMSRDARRTVAFMLITRTQLICVLRFNYDGSHGAPPYHPFAGCI